MVRQLCTRLLTTARSVVYQPCWRLDVTPTSLRYSGKRYQVFFLKHLNSDLVLFAVKYFSAVNPLSPELNPVKFFRHVISLLLVLQCHCSALHPVSEIGDASLVQLLLEYKADPDLRNQVREDKFG